MVRIARERIADLFTLAERESARPDGGYADRYVNLARKVGTRYNIRFPTEYRELYCRGCSTYWVEGRTVRTRLRRTGRVRTCLRCGRKRRLPLQSRSVGPRPSEPAPSVGERDDEALVGETVDEPEPPSASDRAEDE